VFPTASFRTGRAGDNLVTSHAGRLLWVNLRNGTLDTANQGVLSLAFDGSGAPATVAPGFGYGGLASVGDRTYYARSAQFQPGQILGFRAEAALPQVVWQGAGNSVAELQGALPDGRLLVLGHRAGDPTPSVFDLDPLTGNTRVRYAGAANKAYGDLTGTLLVTGLVSSPQVLYVPSGSAPETLAALDTTRPIGLSPTHVYWTEGFVSSGKIQRRPRGGGATETFATPAYLSAVIDGQVYFTKAADGPLIAKPEAGGAERTVVPAGGGEIGLVRKLGECLFVSKENLGIDNDLLLAVTP